MGFRGHRGQRAFTSGPQDGCFPRASWLAPRFLTWNTRRDREGGASRERSLRRRRSCGHRDPVPEPGSLQILHHVQVRLCISRGLSPACFPGSAQSGTQFLGLPVCVSCPARGASALTRGRAGTPPLARGLRLCRAGTLREGLASGSDGKMNKRSVSPGLLPRTAGSPARLLSAATGEHHPLVPSLPCSSFLFSYFPPSSALRVIRRVPSEFSGER